MTAGNVTGEIKQMNTITYMNIGIKLANAGKFQQAAEAFIQAIQLDPNYPEAYNNLGVVFKATNRLDAAETCFRRAIALIPNYLEAYNNLGMVLMAFNRLDEAESCFRSAIKLNPNYLEAYSNLSIVLKELNRLEEAENCFRRIIKLKPDYPNAYKSLGAILLYMNRLEEAESYFHRAIKLNPDCPDTQFSLGVVYLLQGRYDKGWEKYEFRCKLPGNSQPEIRRWHGEDLTGCKILLFHEQGLGDTMQFVRYAQMVAELGAETIVWVQKPLERLLSAPKSTFIIRTGDSIPLEQYNFDFACPLMSLPCVFHTLVETIPQSIPYIQPPSATSLKWREALDEIDGGKTYRVGVAWAGNLNNVEGRKRSIPIELFSKLFDCNEVSWVSLQVGSAIDAFVDVPYKLIDFSQEFVDFSETAGVIENLDLVITVDSAVAHLAGAMGKKVWVLLPFAPDFRWLLEREDSLWYPTMRLFRQQKIGDWQEVIERVQSALMEECLHE